MSDDVLFVGWNQAVRGRELDAAAVFAETIQYYVGLVESGTIDSFEPFLLRPHGGDLNGFILLRGERAKLDALWDDEAFMRHVMKATLVVDGMGMTMGVTGDKLSQEMALFTEAGAAFG